MPPVLKTLVGFNASDGYGPAGGLIADANGDLFGTTAYGGAYLYGDGTVFEIANTATGYASTPTTLVSFNPADTVYPFGSLIADANGDLFGTTEGDIAGSNNDDGTVFEIAHTAIGYASTPTTLVSFNGPYGYYPASGVTADAKGDLFGTTVRGGAYGQGTVFEIAYSGTGYASTPTTLVSFNGTDGDFLFGSLLADANGDLFGTTSGGGANNAGTVFEIANTATGYASTPTTLVSFNTTNGEGPSASLLADANGDLFGTTGGGGAYGVFGGTVFEIANTATGYAGTPTTLASFDGTDGEGPVGSLIADANGDLFGTTENGGANGNGTVFEIANTASGYASTPTTLVLFNGTNGADPRDGLLADANGDLFGTTGGVANGGGTVFEITIPPLAISGALPDQIIYDFATIDPFAGVRVTDVNAGQTETVTVTLGNTVNGTLSDPNAASDGSTINGGVYTVTGSAAAVSADLQALVFHPTDHQVPLGQSVTTGFTISVEDSLAQTDSDTTTSVVAIASRPTKVLVSFNGTDGESPSGSLIADANGDLFGTTYGGGAYSGPNGLTDGTVFEIANTATGYASTPTTLVSFNGTDGENPSGSLLADANGDLFGTAGGGTNGDGTVFEVENTATGYATTPTILFSFNSTGGQGPSGSLIADANGDLFGTTTNGGARGLGTVFEIAHTAAGYASTPTILVNFDGTDGWDPSAGLIADADGDLFGTTALGGANYAFPTYGTVFEIAKTATGYASTPTTLVSFNGTDGAGPSGSLIADADGDLFGTTSGSGGTVFEIAHTATGYASTPTTLASFNFTDGYQPTGSLIADANGDLFGTTSGGGTNFGMGYLAGTVFEIANTATGYASSPTTLLSFNGTGGSTPAGGLLADASGNLFGTTGSGGVNDNGTVFEITIPPLAIIGTAADQTIYDYATIDPFAGVVITDVNSGQTEAVTVTLSNTVNGTLSDPNAASDGSTINNGVYAVTGSAAAVSADLQALVFHPTDHQVPPGQSVTTGFTIAVEDTSGQTASDTTTSVIATAVVPVPPEITGTAADQTIYDYAAIDPFAGVVITDVNSGQTETVTVTLSNTVNGTLFDPSAASDGSTINNGVYAVTGSAAAVSADLQALVFHPTDHQVPPGQSVTTGFTIAVEDTSGQTASDTTTSVIATAVVPVPPEITGTAADQTIYDYATIDPFAGVVITDVNSGQTETVTVTLGNTVNGTLSDPNAASDGSTINNGVYAVTGSAAAVSADLQALVFHPTDHQVPPGQSVTTGFTIAVEDTLGQTASDTTTSVIATAVVPVPPEITGTAADQTIYDYAAIDPFAGVVITDVNSGQTETVTVTLSNTVNGTLFDPNAASDGSTINNGVYAVTGSAAAVSADLQALVFHPTDHQVPPGQSVTTGFTIAVKDTLGQTASDTTTSVIATAAKPAKVLISFNQTNGAEPFGGLIADANGDLFGTTSQSGFSAPYGPLYGTVFEIANTATGYASTPTTLASFNNIADGATPLGSLIADANGDLFGTTMNGGANGDGTVFEIANTATGYASTPTALVSFNGTDGLAPEGSLIADANGDLFGTTQNGGAYLYGDGTVGDGTVFEIANTATGYASTPTTLVSFNGTNGDDPDASLLADANGDLFGTTSMGGANTDGTVFEIVNTATGYASMPTTLVSFNGTDGAYPAGSLLADANGDLFGTASEGSANGHGTAFEIVNTATGYASTPTTLATFDGANGIGPAGSLLADANGDLFGTTLLGGANYGFATYGTVFEIAKTATGYASTPVALVSFDFTNGEEPRGSLLADASGNLFGTAALGGANGFGTVFEITDSGFVVPCFAAGTRIRTTRGDIPVEHLAEGDMVPTAIDGTPAPIVWIGRRDVDCARHPRPHTVWPVRIGAHAFGPGMPARDLTLSPDHAVYVNDVLIPVKHLRNGSTIVQVPLDRVTYYHLELPRHDVLLAEGMPVESFLDLKDGTNYANRPGPIRRYPDFTARMWEAFGCAPLVVTGPELAAARALVERCAAARARPAPPPPGSATTATNPDAGTTARHCHRGPLARRSSRHRAALTLSRSLDLLPSGNDNSLHRPIDGVLSNNNAVVADDGIVL